MIEKTRNYPSYENTDEKIMARKVSLYFTYEQLLAIANIFFYVNKVSARLPRWLGGLRFDEKIRALHKSIHDSCINCCMSLEEMDRFEKEGGGKSGL